MKIVCGIFGILFFFLGNYLPVPDPGLGVALYVCGVSLCLSALAAEIHPFLENLVEEASIEVFAEERKQSEPEPKTA